MSEVLPVIVAALASALVAAAGTGFLVARQVAALSAAVTAKFEGVEKRLDDHAELHRQVDQRLGRLEEAAMRRRRDD